MGSTSHLHAFGAFESPPHFDDLCADVRDTIHTSMPFDAIYPFKEPSDLACYQLTHMSTSRFVFRSFQDNTRVSLLGMPRVVLAIWAHQSRVDSRV